MAEHRGVIFPFVFSLFFILLSPTIYTSIFWLLPEAVFIFVGSPWRLVPDFKVWDLAPLKSSNGENTAFSILDAGLPFFSSHSCQIKSRSACQNQSWSEEREGGDRHDQGLCWVSNDFAFHCALLSVPNPTSEAKFSACSEVQSRKHTHAGRSFQLGLALSLSSAKNLEEKQEKTNLAPGQRPQSETELD